MRPIRGDAPSLPNDPRRRQSGISDADLAAPLKRDAQARVTVDVAGPNRITPDGKLDTLVDHGLAVRTGSPAHIVVRTGKTVVVDPVSKNLETNLGPRDIKGLAEFVKGLIKTTAADVSYAEPLVASSGAEPPMLYNGDGNDVLVSEIRT